MSVKMLYLHWVEGTPQLCPFPGVVAPATACITNAQTAGLNPLCDVFLAAFWVSNVTMMATSSTATHLTLSLHFLLASNPRSLGTFGNLGQWCFAGLGMWSRGHRVGGESCSKGHGEGHEECHSKCHSMMNVRERHQYFVIIYVQT